MARPREIDHTTETFQELQEWIKHNRGEAAKRILLLEKRLASLEISYNVLFEELLDRYKEMEVNEDETSTDKDS